MTLQGKRIVVLGGSFGIGLAAAQAASCEGVVIASSQRARVDKARKMQPEGATGAALNLADAPPIRALFARIGSDEQHRSWTAGPLSLGLLPTLCDWSLGGADLTSGRVVAERLNS